MGPLIQILASATAIALLRGFWAGLFAFALEEIGYRAALNRLVVSAWAKQFKLRSQMSRYPWHWYSLPYKQMTGAISSLFQKEARNAFALAGEEIYERKTGLFRSSKREGESAETARSRENR